MIPADVEVRLVNGRVHIAPASRVPPETMAELRAHRDLVRRLVNTAPEYPASKLLNEFSGDLALIAHLTDRQLRQAALFAACWREWQIRAEGYLEQLDHQQAELEQFLQLRKVAN